MTTKIKNQGFTLVELLISIVIFGILSGIGILGYRQHTKRAYATEVETQLSAASKKLVTTALGLGQTTVANCLNNAELKDSNNFTYSCAARAGASDVFDIYVKPLREIGVGGILSFGIGEDKICWDTCDAKGSGIDAQLSKSHLGISDNCSALTRKERDYQCNCTNDSYQSCGWRRCNCRYIGGGWGWYCTSRCYRCNTYTRKVCETCTEITYVNEDGVVVKL